jgi:hypothetical protein
MAGKTDLYNDLLAIDGDDSQSLSKMVDHMEQGEFRQKRKRRSSRKRFSQKRSGPKSRLVGDGYKHYRAFDSKGNVIGEFTSKVPSGAAKKAVNKVLRNSRASTTSVSLEQVSRGTNHGKTMRYSGKSTMQPAPEFMQSKIGSAVTKMRVATVKRIE